MHNLDTRCIFRFASGEPDIEIKAMIVPNVGDVVEILTGTSSKMQVNGKTVNVKHTRWLKVEKRLLSRIESMPYATILLIVSETTTL